MQRTQPSTTRTGTPAERWIVWQMCLDKIENFQFLIDTTGNATTATTAPGLTYDRLVGFALLEFNHPGGSGLSETATSVSVTRSTNILASPPVPVGGDVLLIDLPTNGANSARRSLELSVANTNTACATGNTRS